MATCLGNYAELLAPIGFSEDEITAHISDRSKSDPPLFDLQPREFLLRLFLRREKIPPALAVDSRSFNDILRGCYNDIRRCAKLEWPKSERCRSQYLPPIVARIVVEPIVIALIVVAIVDLVLPIPRN